MDHGKNKSNHNTMKNESKIQEPVIDGNYSRFLCFCIRQEMKCGIYSQSNQIRILGIKEKTRSDVYEQKLSYRKDP